MLHFMVALRNGFGIDLSLAPRESALILDGAGDVLCAELHYFQLLVPFLVIQLGNWRYKEVPNDINKDLLDMFKEKNRD